MEFLNNLQQVGLLFLQQNKIFSSLSKYFKLIVDDVNEQESDNFFPSPFNLTLFEY